MKYILPLMMLISSVSYAQKKKDAYGDKLPMKDGKVLYEYVDTFPLQSKSDLFNKVAIWASGAFRNSQEANQLVDPDNGEYVAKGNLKSEGALNDTWFMFTLRVSVKDNKCRVQTYNIEAVNTIAPNVSYRAEEITSKKYIRKLNANMDQLANEIFQALKKEKETDNF